MATITTDLAALRERPDAVDYMFALGLLIGTLRASYPDTAESLARRFSVRAARPDISVTEARMYRHLTARMRGDLDGAA